jgi:hypothetical protein
MQTGFHAEAIDRAVETAIEEGRDQLLRRRVGVEVERDVTRRCGFQDRPAACPPGPGSAQTAGLRARRGYDRTPDADFQG